MGDVGYVHLGGDGGMERGDAQIIPPPGVGKVPRKGEKRVVCWCTCSKILQAHHIAWGGVWTRLCTLRERPLSGRLNNCVNFT